MLVAAAAIIIVMLLLLARPRVGRWRVEPPLAVLAGILVLISGGFARATDLVDALQVLWPAMVGIAGVMVLTSSCARFGTLDACAAAVERRVPGTAWALFVVVFVGGWVSAGVLNNDAAVVVNTALVASLLRRRFAAHPEVGEPFLLAAFLGAGVAPLVVSNPMNLTVAHLAGIDFLLYARFMMPVSLVGALVTFGLLVALYHRRLCHRVARQPPSETTASATARSGAALVAAALCGYVICAVRGVPTWPVSLVAAAFALVSVGRACGQREVLGILRHGVAWSVLLVLPIVFVFAAALQRAGAIDAIVPWLRHAGALRIGLSSALGSALLNNHTMALINVAALVPDAGPREVFAALIGGDLGPRFLPFGSLAGLLWLEGVRQQGLHVRLSQFVFVGVVTGVPTLVACLLFLRLLPN